MKQRIDLGFSGAQFMTEQDISGIEADCLESPGMPRVVSVDVYRQYSPEQIQFFCLKHGLYSLPTTELIEWLREIIDGRKAIEVGAGNGVMAKALGIEATDNYQQALPKFKEIYEIIRQPLVSYGDNVLKVGAFEAVKRFKPAVVVGAWVTHKWTPERPELGGNEIGLEEGRIIRRVDDYIVIGNQEVHKLKPILEKPHTMISPDWLVSRAHDPDLNCIYRW